jgi:sugar lactone lactonase YvrE
VADYGNSTIRKITPAGFVTTLAGTAGQDGGTDGAGSAARFSSPQGIAVDSAGNVYVADVTGNTIRKITPAGVVTTLAGTHRQSGSADGSGSAAQFINPAGVAVDLAGNVYVADEYNSVIRKITPAGVVTTLAGTPGVVGSADGSGSAAAFNLPKSVAVDIAGNVYVADTFNHTLRAISPAGAVTTLAGVSGSAGSADGSGSAAQFYQPSGIAVDNAGHIYVADTSNSTIRVGRPEFSGPIPTSTTATTFESVSVASSAPAAAVPAGTPIALALTASAGYSYQWYLNGAPIPGATGSSYAPGQIANLSAGPVASGVTGEVAGPTITTGVAGTADAGVYTVQVTDPSGNFGFVDAGTLAVTENAWLINCSARAYVGTGDQILIGGFVTGGSGSKSILVRGDGPSLGAAPFNVAGPLAAAQLELFSGSTSELTTIGWDPATIIGGAENLTGVNLTAIFKDVGAEMDGWIPGSADVAFLYNVAPGAYTTILSGANDATGIACVEIYDADAATDKEFATTFTGPPTNRLVNLSARANVGTGSGVFIGGFVIAGTTSKTILLRGGGPFLGLAPFGLAGALPSTSITLYDSSSMPIATNTGWGNPIAIGTSALVTGTTAQVGIESATTETFSACGASGDWATGSGDSAMVVTLPPGAYTFIESGVGNATGVGLVEVYEIN